MKDPFEVLPFDAENPILDGYKFVVKLPVQFRDIDMRAHINNAAYFSYLETVRLEYLINVIQIENLESFEEALPIVMASQSMNYRSPAYYRDNLLIGVRVSWVKRSSFGCDFEMRDEKSGRLIADGNYVHIMYDAKVSRSMPMSEEWLTRLEAFEGRKLRDI